MYQKAPDSMAATARSSLPLPVMMTAGTSSSSGPRLFEEVEPVHAGELDVRDQCIRLIASKFRERFFRGRHAKYIKSPSLEQLLVASACVILILDD